MRKQLAVIFPSGTRSKLLLLAGLMVATACVEVLGVASIMPFVAVLTSPEAVAKQPLFSSLFAQVHAVTGLTPPAIAGAMTLAFLLVSNTLMIITQWAMMRFSHGNSHKISTRLMQTYLHQPYSFFLTHHTADITKNIIQEVHRLTIGVVLPLLTLLSKLIVLCLVVGFITCVNPMLAMSVVAVVGLLYGTLYALVRVRMTRLGKIATDAEFKRHKVVQQSLQGAVEVILSGKADYFSMQYEQASSTYAKHYVLSEALTHLPKYVLEVIAFGGIVLMALVQLHQGKPPAEVLSVIGVFAFAGYRLMPAMQQIYASLSLLRYNRPALDIVVAELQRPYAASNHASGTMPLQRTLALQNIAFAYPDRAAVFSDFSMEIPAKKTIGFAGASGSGKTTLMNLFLGLLRPSSGTIAVDGVALSPQNMRQWQNTIGFVPQAIYLLDDSIAANIAFGIPPEEVDMKKVEAAAKRAHIHDFVMTLKEGYASRVGERGVALSGGQRQRIAIARALYHEPSVLVLDEATSALDGATETAVMEAVREMAGQMTIIIVAHRLSTLMVCDEVHVMEQGKIIASGSYADLLDRAVL